MPNRLFTRRATMESEGGTRARDEMTGQSYDVVVLSFRLNSREPLPQLLSRVLGVSLAEAKGFAKGFPFVVREGISGEAAEVIQETLAAGGARVKVEPHRERAHRKSRAPESRRRSGAPGRSRSQAPAAKIAKIALKAAPVPAVSIQAPAPVAIAAVAPAAVVAAAAVAPVAKVIQAGQPTLLFGSDSQGEVQRKIAALAQTVAQQSSMASPQREVPPEPAATPVDEKAVVEKAVVEETEVTPAPALPAVEETPRPAPVAAKPPPVPEIRISQAFGPIDPPKPKPAVAPVARPKPVEEPAGEVLPLFSEELPSEHDPLFAGLATFSGLDLPLAGAAKSKAAAKAPSQNKQSAPVEIERDAPRFADEQSEAPSGLELDLSAARTPKQGSRPKPAPKPSPPARAASGPKPKPEAHSTLTPNEEQATKSPIRPALDRGPHSKVAGATRSGALPLAEPPVKAPKRGAWIAVAVASAGITIFVWELVLAAFTE